MSQLPRTRLRSLTDIGLARHVHVGIQHPARGQRTKVRRRDRAAVPAQLTVPGHPARSSARSATPPAMPTPFALARCPGLVIHVYCCRDDRLRRRKVTSGRPLSFRAVEVLADHEVDRLDVCLAVVPAGRPGQATRPHLPPKLVAVSRPRPPEAPAPVSELQLLARWAYVDRTSHMGGSAPSRAATRPVTTGTTHLAQTIRADTVRCRCVYLHQDLHEMKPDTPNRRTPCRSASPTGPAGAAPHKRRSRRSGAPLHAANPAWLCQPQLAPPFSDDTHRPNNFTIFDGQPYSCWSARGELGPIANWPPTDGASRGPGEILRCLDDAEVQESRTAVQRISTATSPPGTDLIRPKQARELHQRPVSTSMRLVHTEVVIWATETDQCGSRLLPQPLPSRPVGRVLSSLLS